MVATIQELVRVKNRILGVLIRDARQLSGRSITECADLLQMPEAEYQAFETGHTAPTLPQLEILAYYFNVPIGYFWGTETLSSKRNEAELKRRVPELLMLRQRMIGVKLRKMREASGKSIADIAEATGLAEEQIARVEQGTVTLPMSELDMLVRAVHDRVENLIEGQGTVGSWLLSHEEYEQFAELDPAIRAFILKPINQSYLELAMRLSQMEVNKLRTIAESILEITY